MECRESKMIDIPSEKGSEMFSKREESDRNLLRSGPLLVPKPMPENQQLRRSR